VPRQLTNKYGKPISPKFVWKKGDIEIKFPQKKPEGVERVDSFGRAYAGSQRQIQTYVNLRPLELAEKILAQLSLPPFPTSSIRWASPLASDGYKEYRDKDFLRALNLDKYSSDLREFWPTRGPSWDALGVVDLPLSQGVLLVEAKSHSTELQSECKAEEGSMKKIEEALAEAKRWLRIPNPDSYDWTKPFYQAANRYAHLYFLRSRGIQAWLLNMYFLNDPHFKDSAPRAAGEWQGPIHEVEEALGLTGMDVPYTAKLFLEASEDY
jgi:hypothetical protein